MTDEAFFPRRNCRLMVSARRAAFRSGQVPRKPHTRQGASDGCADSDESGRIRPRHQNHPRPSYHQPTAAKVQTGTACRTLSAKTSADMQPDAQPTNRRINRHKTAAQRPTAQNPLFFRNLAGCVLVTFVPVTFPQTFRYILRRWRKCRNAQQMAT